jgi:hypothetical protein
VLWELQYQIQHPLHDLAKLPPQPIGVQSGFYLGDDDIVRFEDV